MTRREILFRGKRTDNGEWVEGYLHIIDTLGSGYTGKAIQARYGSRPYSVAVDPETVCQYTGLTDKNGRKIFEGDILSAYLDDTSPNDITYVQITWNGFSWCTRESTEDDIMTEWDCNTFEVCGNIFDNPELIN